MLYTVGNPIGSDLLPKSYNWRYKMPEQKYKIIRKADVKKGKVILTFRVYAEGVLQYIAWDDDGYSTHRCCTSTTFHERLSEEVFTALTPEEIKGLFGRLELPQEAKIGGGGIIVPATRDAVRLVTAQVTKWIARGLERCQALQNEKGLDEWLWENAVAEPPEYRWRLAEKK